MTLCPGVFVVHAFEMQDISVLVSCSVFMVCSVCRVGNKIRREILSD